MVQMDAYESRLHFHQQAETPESSLVSASMLGTRYRRKSLRLTENAHVYYNGFLVLVQMHRAVGEFLARAARIFSEGQYLRTLPREKTQFMYIALCVS